jgi:hypothetical protein
MALETWTVIFDCQSAGTLDTAPATTGGSVEVEGKNKALTYPGPVNAAATPQNPVIAKVAVVEAESAAEAAKFVRAVWGNNIGNAKFLTAKTSNVAETAI